MGKIRKIWMRLPQKLRGFIIYNCMFFPGVAAIYIPYNIFWIQMTTLQLAKWVLTAAIFGSIANIGLSPWIRYINRTLTRRGYLKGPAQVPALSPCANGCGVLARDAGGLCPYCKEMGN